MAERTPAERIAFLEGQQGVFAQEVRAAIEDLRRRDDEARQALSIQTKEIVGQMREGNHGLRADLQRMALNVATTERTIGDRITVVKDELTKDIGKVKDELAEEISEIRGSGMRLMLGGTVMMLAAVGAWLRDHLDITRLFK